MIAYVAKVEREFWALAEGPWASEPGGGMQFRARWASSVRSASSAADLANCLLQLETSLRPVAFSKEWLGEGPVGGLAAGAQGDDSNAGSRAMSRATSAADLQGAAASMAGSEDAEDDGTGGQRVDPYDLRATRLSFGDWEMNRRHHAAHILSVNRLPSHLLRKVRARCNLATLSQEQLGDNVSFSASMPGACLIFSFSLACRPLALLGGK